MSAEQLAAFTNEIRDDDIICTKSSFVDYFDSSNACAMNYKLLVVSRGLGAAEFSI